MLAILRLTKVSEGAQNLLWCPLSILDNAKVMYRNHVLMKVYRRRPPANTHCFIVVGEPKIGPMVT